MKSLFKQLLNLWRTSRNPWLRFVKEVVWFVPVVYMSLPGLLRRCAVKTRLIIPPRVSLHTGTDGRERKIIVSLTSYGRRVHTSAPAAIISLMRQTLKPDKIILWLARDEFPSPQSLPAAIRRLERKGLEVRYVDRDMRSYKKIIPALMEFPDDWIVTADDDLWYPARNLERGWQKICQTGGRAVVCGLTYKVVFARDGSVRPYRDWPQNTPDGNFPLSGSLAWWRRDLLHPDILRYDLASRLTPNADDIWDFIMAVLVGTPIVGSGAKRPYVDLDLWYQHWHSNASLTTANFYGGQNDSQLREVMSHYSLTDSDLRRYLMESAKTVGEGC